ncbi:hypothetical protein CDL12_27059 [Handroanthus impetiginosus]|uniref:Uncharacterized protein n=1 Tax=Handroanthus impetiginosus TaxID=429701 RepID=A0A2G9G543_9LAMI|nr:hypothetical protein CDL12_27059 [Handroanthus impetiginosus]
MGAQPSLVFYNFCKTTRITIYNMHKLFLASFFDTEMPIDRMEFASFSINWPTRTPLVNQNNTCRSKILYTYIGKIFKAT